MPADLLHTWPLVMAVGLLCGWWLTLRDGSSYRGVGYGVSLLIVLTAVLMSALAVLGQGQGARLQSTQAATSPGPSAVSPATTD